METEIEQYKSNYIPTASHVNWNEYFMLLAMMASYKNKDPSTTVGSVFVDEDHHQISMGYNGMIAGIDESQTQWGKCDQAPLTHQKYDHVVHSEANAIYMHQNLLKALHYILLYFPVANVQNLLHLKK